MTAYPQPRRFGYQRPPGIVNDIPDEQDEREALKRAAGAGGRGGAAAKALDSWDGYKAEKTAGVLDFDAPLTPDEVLQVHPELAGP